MDFYQRARIVCESIPEGRVATYGQIALLCGKPKNARQVGYALNKGRLGEVPAWRILGSSGRLSGAASFETYDMQKLLLEAEEWKSEDRKRVENGFEKIRLEEYDGRSGSVPQDI
ncbi:MAG: MGMT family protein [Lachnospiraceae bacterium]